jgi:DNA-binding NarL/FixJ family response regulator
MKVVIIDDHPLARKGIGMILSLEGDIEVAGEAQDSDSGIKLITEVKPDIALIDLKLGKECGLDILNKIDRKKLSCKIAIITISIFGDDFKKAKEMGVDGYILKDALPEEICYAVRVIARGRKYFDPGMIESIMKTEDEIGIDSLTPRERDVLRALGEGLTNMEISKRLYITEHTVKKHVGNIFSKLGFIDRTQAAIYAVHKGLIRN